MPQARADAEAGKLAFGTVDSWLVWNLTRGSKHVTDRTNADLARHRHTDAIFEPKADPTEMRARQAKWQGAVHRARRWNKA